MRSSITRTSTMRSVTICVILGTACTVAFYYNPLLMYFQKSYQALSTFNITSSINFLTLSLFDSEFSNSSWFNKFDIKEYEQNITNFDKWQSAIKLNVTLYDKLHEISDMVKVAGTNCSALFAGSNKANAKMLTKTNKRDTYISEESFIKLASNCARFQTSRGYVMASLTAQEDNFPLAYSILIYKDLEMFERLLRAIYRPQNYYCVHVDAKSNDKYYNATLAIVNCFPNVFVTSKRFSVWWGAYSVLEPELQCMEELWKYPKWKYFINLTGQEFPLKTNSELVNIFTAYLGATDSTTMFRWNFIDYILHNSTAKTILEWTKYTDIPDETFFAILNSNPRLGIRGTYTGTDDGCDNKMFLARYKMWRDGPCAGIRRKQLCIFAVGDLPRLFKTEKLFANKFYLYLDRSVIGCLEEKIFNDTRDEYSGVKIFNTSFYSNIDFVKHQVV